MYPRYKKDVSFKGVRCFHTDTAFVNHVLTPVLLSGTRPTTSRGSLRLVCRKEGFVAFASDHRGATGSTVALGRSIRHG